MKLLLSLYCFVVATNALGYIDTLQSPTCLVVCLIMTLNQSDCDGNILTLLCSKSTFDHLRANEPCFVACGVDSKEWMNDGSAPRTGRAQVRLRSLVNSTIQEAEKAC
jgi:hypothetical protein